MAGEPIRILKLLATTRLGGTEVSVLGLVKGLDPEMFAVETAFLEPPGPISERFEAQGFPTHHVSHAPGLIYRLVRLIEKTRAQVVVAYGFRANLSARLAGRVSGTMVLGGLRSIKLTDAEDEGSLKEKQALTLDKVTFPLSRGYVSNSYAAAHRLARLGYPKEKLFVVQGGIDFRRKSPPRASLDLPWPDGPVITTVGNLKPVKGQAVLIEAARALWDRGFRFNLVFVGDGPLRSRLERRAEKAGLGEAALFLGTRDDVDAILAASHVFVLPSLWEGLPVAVMEAMAHSLPVVATSSGGTPELFTVKERNEAGLSVCREGFLVPPRKPEGLAAGLAALLEDEALRDKMGSRARRRIEETFNMERVVRETAGLYEKLYREWEARR